MCWLFVDIRTLFDNPINVNETFRNIAQSNRDCTLHEAVLDGNPYLVELVLESGADVNAVDSDGLTALMRVAGQKDIDVAEKRLRELGESQPSTARFALVEGDIKAIFHEEHHFRAELEFLVLAIYEGICSWTTEGIKKAENVIAKHCGMAVHSFYFIVELFVLVIGHRKKTVDLLLKAGSDVNLTAPNNRNAISIAIGHNVTVFFHFLWEGHLPEIYMPLYQVQIMRKWRLECSHPRLCECIEKALESQSNSAPKLSLWRRVLKLLQLR